jgi:hypothetical protein
MVLGVGIVIFGKKDKSIDYDESVINNNISSDDANYVHNYDVRGIDVDALPPAVAIETEQPVTYVIFQNKNRMIKLINLKTIQIPVIRLIYIMSLIMLYLR